MPETLMEDMDDLIEEFSDSSAIARAVRTLARHIREIEAELDHHDKNITDLQLTR